MIDHCVEHQAEVLHGRDIVPVAEGGINLTIVHDREAVVGSPWVERQDVNPADDIGQIFVAKFLEGLKRLRIRLLNLIAVENEERVALAESAVPWREA